MSVRILVGDCRASLASLPAESAQTCVTSPPYWGLRDYGVDGQLGLEETPEKYVAGMVSVFREVRRVLRDDGTLWLNLGDSYAATSRSSGASLKSTLATKPTAAKTTAQRERGSWSTEIGDGLKPKDLVGIPWRVAFALQADGAASPQTMRVIERMKSAILADFDSWDYVPDRTRGLIESLEREWNDAHRGGWYLRSDIIWHKPNPMPESVTDRPTKSHEYVFLLSKSERYAYDAAAIAEGSAGRTDYGKMNRIGRTNEGGEWDSAPLAEKTERNARTVWSIATHPFSGAHFATMPPALAERCILAGCPEGLTNVVLDPFGGAGTTGLVAQRLGRSAVLCELNESYAQMAAKRIREDAPMFSAVTVGGAP